MSDEMAARTRDLVASLRAQGIDCSVAPEVDLARDIPLMARFIRVSEARTEVFFDWDEISRCAGDENCEAAGAATILRAAGDYGYAKGKAVAAKDG